jgi:membrane protein required for colicin V production
MQTYDAFMLVVLVGATVFGFYKGMAWQIASLASLVVSYFASLRFSEQLAPVFGQQAPFNKFVAMAAIYVGTSFFIWTMFRFVSGVIDRVRLESFDRQIGGIIGFAKGVLLCILITMGVVMLLPEQGKKVVNSRSGHYIVALLDKAHSVFPPEIHQVVDPWLNDFEKKLNPNFVPHESDQQPQWPSQAQATTPIEWPQQGGQTQQQQQWPTTPQSQPAWPSSTQQQPQWPAQNGQSGQPYDASSTQPQEPNPYPGPYSAEVPGTRDY